MSYYLQKAKMHITKLERHPSNSKLAGPHSSIYPFSVCEFFTDCLTRPLHTAGPRWIAQRHLGTQIRTPVSVWLFHPQGQLVNNCLFRIFKSFNCVYSHLTYWSLQPLEIQVTMLGPYGKQVGLVNGNIATNLIWKWENIINVVLFLRTTWGIQRPVKN